MWAIIVLVVSAIIVTVVVLVAFPDPEVGDCIRGTKAVRTKIVGCDDPAAGYRVVRKIESSRDMTEEEAERQACVGHPDGTPTVFFARRPPRVDFAICSVPIR